MARILDSPRQAPRWLRLAGASLIMVLTFAVYFPALTGGFIFDDNLLLTDNALIKAHDGLHRIWLTTEPYEYYPISYSSLWIEWRLWDRNPTGYHIASAVLHIASALLIWSVLQRLAIPGAFLAALLFVVHPVNVESVAWIAQRRNNLAIVFALLSILWYLRDEEGRGKTREAERRRGGEEETRGLTGFGFWYWLSLLAFVLAMLSKGSVAMLPVVLLFIIWWQQSRWTAQSIARTVPFFLIAAVLTCINVWFQTHGADVVIREAGFGQRLAGAGAVVWFYLSKAFVPIDLVLVYPQWRISTGNLLWWLPLLAAVAVTFQLWRKRSSPQANWGPALWFAWGFFCVALTPVLGFADVGFMEYTLVADHYQQIALIGVVALVAAGWSAWNARGPRAIRWAAVVFATAVVGLLSLLTWRQNWLYTDSVLLYEATLKQNPDSWLAHNLLGNELLATGRLPESIEHFQRSLRLQPNSAVAHNDLGVGLFHAGRIPEAIDQYREALNLKPDYAEACNNLGFALITTGRLPEAIEQYEQAVRIKPDFAEAYNGLGTAARMQDRPQEAIEYYGQALRIEPDYARAYANLSLAYAQLHQTTEAVGAAQKALELARAQGKWDLAQQVEGWLESYRGAASNLPQGSVEKPSQP